MVPEQPCLWGPFCPFRGDKQAIYTPRLCNYQPLASYQAALAKGPRSASQFTGRVSPPYPEVIGCITRASLEIVPDNWYDSDPSKSATHASCYQILFRASSLERIKMFWWPWPEICADQGYSFSRLRLRAATIVVTRLGGLAYYA